MKSPGLDGLTYEFYRSVWDIIGKSFVEVLQVQLERLNLIESDKMGATKLASKVDGVPGVDEFWGKFLCVNYFHQHHHWQC